MRYATVTDALVRRLIGFIEMRNSVGGLNHPSNFHGIVNVSYVRHDAWPIGQLAQAVSIMCMPPSTHFFS